MEQNFRRAVDFLDHTGSGIEDKQSLHQAVTRICPYYYELESVMIDRSTNRPLAEADELDYSIEEQNDTEDVLNLANQE